MKERKRTRRATSKKAAKKSAPKKAAKATKKKSPKKEIRTACLPALEPESLRLAATLCFNQEVSPEVSALLKNPSMSLQALLASARLPLSTLQTILPALVMADPQAAAYVVARTLQEDDLTETCLIHWVGLAAASAPDCPLEGDVAKFACAFGLWWYQQKAKQQPWVMEKESFTEDVEINPLQVPKSFQPQAKTPTA